MPRPRNELYSEIYDLKQNHVLVLHRDFFDNSGKYPYQYPYRLAKRATEYLQKESPGEKITCTYLPSKLCFKFERVSVDI